MRKVIPALAVLLACGACSVGGLDWSGDAASVSMGWTIRGVTAGPAACAALGAVRARLVLRVGEGRWIDPDLQWPCEAGAGASDATFLVATLDFGLELLDPADQVVAWSAWNRRTVAPGENPLGTFDLHVAVPPPDASVTVRWTVGGVPADAAACAAAGGSSVRLDWRVGTLAGEPFEWPCAAGTGRAELALRSGLELDFRVRLLDADGFTISTAPRGSWFIDTLEAGDNELETFDLSRDATRAPLSVLLYWADRVEEPATYADCAAAGVARLGYALEDGGGGVVDAAPLATDARPCTEYLSWPSLVPDTYTLIVEGEDESGAQSWTSECWGLEVSDPADNSFICRVPRLH
jgi:hypothetical protein